MELKKVNEENKENKVVKLAVGVSSSGTHLYNRIKYKWSEEAKCMIPYFDKPVDMYKMIQASKNATDIAAIVKRAAAGDVSVLNVKNGYFADVSDMPDNLNDMHLLNTEAINSFSKLDPKIQAVFDNDYKVFAAAVSDGTYVDRINSAIFASNKNVEKQEVEKQEMEVVK